MIWLNLRHCTIVLKSFKIQYIVKQYLWKKLGWKQCTMYFKNCTSDTHTIQLTKLHFSIHWLRYDSLIHKSICQNLLDSRILSPKRAGQGLLHHIWYGWSNPKSDHYDTWNFLKQNLNWLLNSKPNFLIFGMKIFYAL